MTPKPGTVYLVGTGPGDPDLLTLKGKKCLEAADVVVYDQRVNSMLLNHARTGAEMVYVGKKAAKGCSGEREIQEILVGRAREGKQVVRLGAGDPFVFSHGAEEVEALKSAGIPYQVVSGVSSATAVPAYAGIPLTHRAHASSVAFVSGHSSLDGKSIVDWSNLARAVDTIVILRGVKNLREIMKSLLNAGCDADRPVAIIECGTRESQRSITGTVNTITKLVKKCQIQPPAIIVVGEVVRFGEQIGWYDKFQR